MNDVSDKKAEGGLKVTLSNLARKMIPTPVKAFIGRRMTKGIAKKRPIVVSTDGRQFKTIEDGLFFRVFYEGIYEPDLTSAFTKYLEADDTILDVGASFGWYTTLFAKSATTGKVIAYEPTPDTFDILEENIVLNEMNWKRSFANGWPLAKKKARFHSSVPATAGLVTWPMKMIPTPFRFP